MKNMLRISAMLLLASASLSAFAQQSAVADVYKKNCAMCHGATGDANTPAGKTFKVPSFTAEAVVKESDADLLAVEKNGKGKMPAWHDKLSDDQLKGLVAYIRSFQKK